MNASLFGGGNICSLAVEQQVGERRPHQCGTDLRHLGEFLLAKGYAMDQDQFSDEEVVLDENIKFSTASFIHTFGDVDEPCIQFAAAVSGLDVVADIIRGQLGDLGVDFIPLEVVIFDVSCENGCITVIGVAGATLGSSCASDNGFHFDVFHRLGLHVPVRS